MLRIATTILALVMLILAIKAFTKDMKTDDLAVRVASFLLLVIASVLFILVAIDTFQTWVLLVEFCLGEIRIIEPPIYPATAELYGIWTHPFNVVVTLDVLCALTLVSVIVRKKIPGLLARDNRIVG